MADRSKIEWTDASWNPIRAIHRASGKKGWHCEHLSPGCANCYSGSFNARLGTGLPFKPGHRADVDIVLDPAMLLQPLCWKRPRMIFVCSMTDLFADFVPDAFIDQVFAVMALCPQHTFQVLTKRSARMRAYCSDAETPRRIYLAACEITIEQQLKTLVLIAPGVDASLAPPGPRVYLGRWPVQNVWLGVSAEDQRRADERVPDLLATPAAVRLVSAEPLLSKINFRRLAIASTVSLDALTGQFTAASAFGGGLANYQTGLDALPPLPERRPALDWVIVGGESGRGASPMHPDWAHSLRDQCAAVRVPFFFKQWGEWRRDGKPVPGGDLGGDIRADRVRHVCADRENDGHFRRGDVHMRRVGKKAAGRLLDGIEHNDMLAIAATFAGAA